MNQIYVLSVSTVYPFSWQYFLEFYVVTNISNMIIITISIIIITHSILIKKDICDKALMGPSTCKDFSQNNITVNSTFSW